ncbi:MAG TPA: LLM class F420-dependent oxidoreductase [Ktedonobacterales bacterium]|nr:LLM class F420-dependent oxidoreductase [Ktedonobacterales bacterium]
MGVRFGVFVPQGWRMDLQEIADPIEQYEAMTGVAKEVDELPAYDSIWVYDHFHPIPEPVPATVFECWTITAALARDTRRVHVGQMVTCAGYRNPALLAKMASTVDVLSHGRLYCGLGAGWYEDEWRAYGYGFPSTGERMGAFREACQIVSQMWTADAPVFHGKHYSIKRAINEPKGVRKPHPSLWIGGSGERVTLRLVAEYGDACNVSGDAETLRHKFTVLREHCEAVGRPYDDIIRSTSLEDLVLTRPGEEPAAAIERARSATGVSFAGSTDELGERIQSLVEAGANYVIVSFPRLAYDHEPLYRFASEVIPRFSDS